MKATFKAFPVKPAIPLVVIGALKAGGSGKTSVTLALAQIFAERGLKVAILAYRIGGKCGPKKSEVLQEVPEDANWRMFSDEAVLLKRMSKCRVFVTRNRAQAWMALHSVEAYGEGAFDLILSDDGFQDPRLRGALRILLTAPGERPGVFDLIPGGTFRETKAAKVLANIQLCGPIPRRISTDCQSTVPFVLPKLASTQNFYRAMILPEGLDLRRPWIAYCALGDNEPFLQGLLGNQVQPVMVVQGPNHAEPNIKRLLTSLNLYPGAGILCTPKDYLKFSPEFASKFPIFSVDQQVFLDPETVHRIEAFRLGFVGGNLVH